MNDTILTTTINDFSLLLFLAQLLPIVKLVFWTFIGYYIVKLYKAILKYVTRFDNGTG